MTTPAILRSASLSCAFAAFALSACGEPDIGATRTLVAGEDEQSQATATLSYRERIALGPDAVADAALFAEGGDGEDRIEIARQTTPLLGAQPPVDVQIAYAPSAVPQGAPLTFEARIEDGARSVWSTIEPLAVPSDGALGEIALTRRAIPEDAASAREAELYQCESVQLETVYEDPQLVLTFDGNAFRLDPVEAASGARFAAGEGRSRVEFWSRGDEATFRLGEDEEPETCERQAADAAMGGLEDVERYTALGHEPGWRLDVAGNMVRFTGDYGDIEIESEVAGYDRGEGGEVIRAGAGVDALEVRIGVEQCADGATGKPYPDTVSVHLGDRTFEGCGGDPEQLLTGGQWIVRRFGGDAMDYDPPAAIQFEGNGRMTGRGPCNSFTGGYQMTGEGLNFTGVASTRRACVDEQADAAEAAFFTALEGPARYTLDGEGALRIETENGAIDARRP